jgi:hypothetical protein
MSMREEFERKAEELKCGYEKKMKTVFYIIGISLMDYTNHNDTMIGTRCV